MTVLNRHFEWDSLKIKQKINNNTNDVGSPLRKNFEQLFNIVDLNYEYSLV